ncbi:MAG: ABC transporter ATP-binding protein [Tissierellaceae bacterium]|nr:ABC transporter ATP-binding protein [Tissierellaceae bacterium]
MTETILKVENVTQRFGGLTAVNGVNMEVKSGEIIGIIGPNGAGKTTFFNDITGVYSPTEGKILLNDKDITGMKPFEITQLGMARTFQNIRLFYRMTVLENVMVGMHSRTKSNLIDSTLKTKAHRETEKEAEKRALEVLELTGLADYRYNYATSLPYGLQRRLEIARAMATNPSILLFDEPAAGMNEQETSDLMAFIRDLKGYGYTIILIEHDMRLVMNICERIYVLDHGNLIAEGIPSEIKANPRVIEAYLGKGVD